MTSDQRPDERVEAIRMNREGSISKGPTNNSDIDPSGLLTEMQLGGIRERQNYQEHLGSLGIELLLLNHIDALTARAERAERVVEAARPCRHILPVYVSNNEAVSRLDEELVVYDMGNRESDAITEQEPR